MIFHSPDGLGNVAKSVDGSTTNRLLVGLEELEQFKADPHPFAGRDELGASVGDTANQIDTVLLHLKKSIKNS